MTFFDKYIYFRKSAAKKEGFTNHAVLYGVPIWFGVENNEVAAKLPFFGDILIDICCFISIDLLGNEGFYVALGDEI